MLRLRHIAVMLIAVVFYQAVSHAQITTDTTKFKVPVPVPGEIPGLYKWANTQVSDSAVVNILSPAPRQRLREGDSVFVTVSVSGVAVGAQTEYAELCGLANSADGQHTHVIIDNEPYKANYKAGQPFAVGILKPGVHTLRVFAARSWHESIKSPESFKSLNFYVGDSTAPPVLDPAQPLLTYSRPKGEYVGPDTRAIIVDFYLTNVSLSPDGYKVRLTVDGKSALLSEWAPYIVTGLAMGDHRFKLELLNKDGKNVAGPFNTTERTISLKATP